MVVDFIGRYENLHNDLATAMKRAGLPHLALAGSEKRRVYSQPWRDYYQSGDKARVETLYGKEIELFGYRFNS